MTKRKWALLALALALVIAILGVSLYTFLYWLPAYREQQAMLAYMEQYAIAKEASFAEENPLFAPFQVDVAFLGDSLTDFYPVAQAFPDYVTANRGIGGDTTFELEERLDVSVYALKPKVAVLLIGVNNLDTAMDNYERILQGLAANLPETRVVVLSLTPVGSAWADKNPQVALHNVEIGALALKYGYTYVDIFTPLYDININALADVYSMDGVHLTDAAYHKITECLTPVLAAELAAWQGE